MGAAVVVVIILAVLIARVAMPASQLAPAPGATSTAGGHGQTVDGIPCETNEQVSYHVHAHLAVYVNGQERQVPYGIGIVPPYHIQQSSEGPFVASGSCFYWLHAHTRDGIIHIESPQQQDFTLGQYFDIWGQPLSATQVGPASGTVIAYVNGVRFTGDPRTIPLTDHTVVQLDVGTDVAPKPFTFPQGL